MDLNEIIQRNYQATVKRGLIFPYTNKFDFFIKIEEEVNELKQSVFSDKTGFDEFELSDIILVCLAMARHYGIDIKEALELKTKFNEQRKD